MIVAAVSDLASVSLFDSLDDDQRTELTHWFHVQKNVEGTRLVGEGAAGYTFFVLLEGEADVTSAGERLATLVAGDFFGEIGILGDGRRTATVTSTTPVRLLVMFGTEFRRLEAAYPDIAARIESAMQTRLASRIPQPGSGAATKPL